jgi:hypothetical protein
VRAKKHVVSFTLHAVNENGRDAFAFDHTGVRTEDGRNWKMCGASHEGYSTCG